MVRGGPRFGTIFVFLLLAGEIYTTFTFLGASGYAYGRGAPTYYILGYGCLAYILSYWLLPLIWRYAKDNRLISQSDFFSRKYDSPTLGIVVSLVGLVALVPYLVLQLKGLGIIVAAAGYGAVSSTTAIWVGAAVVTAYVMASGVRGSAWTAVVKDVMILAIVVFLGLYLPIHYYGGLTDMFQAIDAAKPGFLALPPKAESAWWFASTVLLTALGFFMWPHSFASVFTAREAQVFRRNAIVLPLYQLIMLFVFFVGFAAILQVPGLQGPEIDLALVPGSMILMAAATLLAHNLYRLLRRSADDAEISRLARLMVPLVAFVAVAFTLEGGATIVALLLMAYSFVTQLFPALVCSLMRYNFVTKEGAIAGILAGVATVATVTLTQTTLGKLVPALPQAVQDLNIGIVALIVNVVVLVIVSRVARAARMMAQLQMRPSP